MSRAWCSCGRHASRLRGAHSTWSGPPERAVRPRDALAALASGLPALADRTRSLRTWLPPASFRLFFPPCPMLASPKVDLFTGSERSVEVEHGIAVAQP